MRRSGFSLVELSIVLVILGLLVGGILAGQSLIRASELRAVGNEFTRYQTATSAFRDKYFALPGDMATATSFWGAINPTPGICRGTASPDGVKTCNGDGNGYFTSLDGVTNSEMFHYWVQLAAAGMIEGQYTGVSILPYPDMTAVSLGKNIPASRLDGGGFTPWYCGNCWMGAIAYGKNLLVFGAPVASAYTIGGILTGTEAWNIDTKYDDGKMTTGRVGATYDVTSCNGNYILTNTNRGCDMLWILN